MPLQPGIILHNQYRVIRLIGQGGFGFVYQAADTLVQEKVAIKEFAPQMLNDPDILRRFLVEAKATMRLRHHSIVATRTIFEERGNYYIVLEFMPGGSLEDHLQRGALSVNAAVRLGGDMCAALEYAHGLNMVHCDFKPANILFAQDGAAKLADFGIAHVPQALATGLWGPTSLHFIAGTLPYMSPEQLSGRRDDPRTDIYALGAVLYESLTGRLYHNFDPANTPLAQANNIQLINNVMPAPPRTYNPQIPAWLDAVIMRCLEKAPAARYQSAHELADALQGSANVGAQRAAPVPAPVQPAPPAPRQSPPKSPKKRGGSGINAVVALLMLVVLGSVGMFTLRQIMQPEPTATPRPPTTVPSTPVDVRVIGGAEMVYVPAGEFIMGSEDGDDDEKPVHTVYLDAYWIDKYEVTNAQFKQCVDAGVCSAPTTCGWGEPTYQDADKADHPVVCVDWENARKYCEWAEKRLPTEAEWEKAARGTDGRTYPWGNEWDVRTTRRGNFSDKNDPTGPSDDVADDGYAYTAPVGSYPAGASPYGARDMAGNVWEWTADWYDGDYYANSPARDPSGPFSGSTKVIRGGSWDSYGGYVRAAFRLSGDPSDTATSSGCVVFSSACSPLAVFWMLNSGGFGGLCPPTREFFGF